MTSLLLLIFILLAIFSVENRSLVFDLNFVVLHDFLVPYDWLISFFLIGLSPIRRRLGRGLQRETKGVPVL